jgi:hypothetical protein
MNKKSVVRFSLEIPYGESSSLEEVRGSCGESVFHAGFGEGGTDARVGEDIEIRGDLELWCG